MRLIDADALNGYELGLISPKAQKLFHKIINDAPSQKTACRMSEWIPVSERLPEFTINKLVVGTQFTEDVLVYDGADFRVGYFARKDKLDCNYWVVYGEDYFEPIAWMPIVQYRASPTDGEVEND